MMRRGDGSGDGDGVAASRSVIPQQLSPAGGGGGVARVAEAGRVAHSWDIGQCGSAWVTSQQQPLASHGDNCTMKVRVS